MKGIAASFLLVPLLLTGCVVPYGGADAATTATAAVDGYARLDEAGIAQIKASRSARLDMTSGQLTKESVGLENGTSQAPDVVMPDGILTAGSLEDFTSLIRDGMDRYGIPSESAERWIESMSSRPEDKGDFALRPGT